MADPIVNFFKSTLVGTYSNTDTSFTITTGDGAKLPDPSTDGEFNLVIFEGGSGALATAFEIVRVTAKSGDVLTVTREQEGTSALTIGATTHSIILSATKKTFDDIQTAISNVDVSNIAGAESITFDTTGDEVFQLPSGTTAQRPVSPSVGYMRLNTDTKTLEYYTGNIWAKLSTDSVISMLAAGANTVAYDGVMVEPVITVEYLVIAGGGGGNYHGGLGSPWYWLGGGGGGGGGYRSSVSGESSGGGASAESALDLDAGTNYTVTVGAGGSGGTSGITSGSSSVFSTITSTGGGRGGGDAGSNQVGGSGGGAGGFTSTGSAGTANQGYKGKDLLVSGEFYLPGGGGGASQTPTTEGRGGLGVVSSITGASVGRAGGGGSGHSGSKTAYHGGGAGSSTGAAASGTANTGGGGGGAGGTTASGRSGGNGGSGVVILRYPSSYTISVGAGLTATTTTVGANKVTTFTAGTGTISF